MHRVSDHLADRHPYLDLGFNESYDSTEVHRAFGHRVIPKYAELLVVDDLPHEDRAQALAELCELLSNQETKFQAVHHELMFACADLTDSPSLDVRVNAAHVIAALVLHNTDASGSDELSTEAMLRAATLLLSDTDTPAVLAGCTIFQNLTLSTEGALLLASRIEIVGTITSMVNAQPLKTLSEPIVRAVLAILANLTRVFEGAQICAECAITSPVLGVLKKCVLYDAETVYSAARIVLNAATHDQGKRLAIHQGGVEVCLKVLSKVLSVAAPQTFHNCGDKLHEELTRCLVGAIMALSTVEDAKPRIVEFGIEPLVKCLHHDNQAIKQNAVIAIRSACEAAKGTATFVDKLLAETELLVEVLGVQCIPSLLRYLRITGGGGGDGGDGDDDGNDDARLDALAVLEQLLRGKESDGRDQEHAAADQVVQTLHLVDALVEMMVLSAAQLKIRNKAVSVLQLLVAHGDKYARRVGQKLLKNGVCAKDFALVMSIDMASFQANA